MRSWDGTLTVGTVLVNAGPWLPVPPYGYGGIERVVATLVPELRRRGLKVLLASVADSGLEVDGSVAAFRSGQFPVLADPYPQVVGVAHAHAQAVVDAVRQGPEIDLIHDHTEVVGASIGALLGADAPPTLQTLHWDLRKHPGFYAQFDGRGRVFFNGVSQRQVSLAPVALRRQILAVVHLAVPLDEYPPSIDKADYVLSMGRIAWIKGTDLAVRACAEARVPLVLAGPVGGAGSADELDRELARRDGPVGRSADVDYFTALVRPHLDGHQIRWVGEVGGDRKVELLRHARALLMPNRWEEPGGTVAIEALACGTPVVATRRGALAEVIEHGVTGWLVDDDADLPRALSRVDELSPEACRAAAERCFSAPVMAERYIHLYERVLAAAV